MSNQAQTAYKRLIALNEQAESASYSWVDSGDFEEWTHSVRSALKRLFKNNNLHLEAFDGVSYTPIMFTTGTSSSVFRDSFMSGMRSARGIIRSAIQEFEDYEQQTAEPLQAHDDMGTETTNRKVFVVHGHDEEMKEKVARFLTQVGLEPVILHEQANAGDTIIEKFERHATASYAVVLLSPDDQGKAKGTTGAMKPRARQNVVLELGYFVGRLGRKHVCPLVRGHIEVPSDLLGVVYVPFEGDGWKLHLVKELKHVGFDIDANKAF